MAERKRVWLWALVGLGGALLMVFAVVVGPWLLTRFPHEGITAEQELKAKNDVRTTLVQALAGLAVAGGLVVTYRTFRHNRIEQDRTYDLRRAEQVNELYTTAVEQLGHEEAPVRLGALYSLVHLAQANPDRRQTVVDVLCAYLRMPYAPESTAGTSESTAGTSERDPAQELQVRLTAQRLLGDHLRRPKVVSGEDAQRRTPSPEESFWPGIRLDLTGASLIDLNLSEASIIGATFERATFSGAASFDGGTFSGVASFHNATFSDVASFDGGTFSGDASFNKATFSGARFRNATFSGAASFDGGTFSSAASFNKATFSRAASFEGATFSQAVLLKGTTFGYASFRNATFYWAWFHNATFSGAARFDGATFSDDGAFDGATFSSVVVFAGATFGRYASFRNATFGFAWFRNATFSGPAWFRNATFSEAAEFVGATFSGDVEFDEATFKRASFDGAHVLNLGDPDSGDGPRRVWPDGWTARRNLDDPTRGTLMRAPAASHLEPPAG